MLSEGEKVGVKNVLRMLTSDQLKSLASTISKAQVVLQSDQECIRAILNFEKSGGDFLRRKIITKKIITQYAFQEKIPMHDADSKDDVISLILKYWSKPDTQSLCPSYSYKEVEATPLNGSLANRSKSPQPVNVNIQINLMVQPGEQDIDQRFGEKFCQWFFDMLNNSDPVSQGFGPSNFFPEAQMFTCFVSPGNTVENSYLHSDSISNCLLDLFKVFRFNPNICAEGLRVKSNPYGLKLILICGLLYRGISMCGTFQQSFGLRKDPYTEDKWKIHVIALKCTEIQGPQNPFLDLNSDVEKIAVEFFERNR